MILDSLPIVAAATVGLAVGSFLNVVIYRVPAGRSVIRPASACAACEQPIRPADNVPILSWFLLKGRCRACGVRISPRYAVVEAMTGLAFAATALVAARVDDGVFAAAALAVLIVLAVIDLDTKRVPNVIVLPATAVALAWVVVDGVATGRVGSIGEAIGAGAAGFAVLFVIAFVSGGMGFGDVKLAAFIGVVVGWFGWAGLLLALFAAFVAGGLVAVALLATGRSGRKDAIPFAPMLCFGAAVALFVGDAPVRAWLGLP